MSGSIDYAATTVIRGKPLRTLRVMGGTVSVGVGLITLPIWFLHEPGFIKLTVAVMIIAFVVVLTGCAVVIAAFTIARLEGGRLDFWVCGVRVRSIPLDDITGYKHVFRRGSAICIVYGPSSYVPNGAFEHDELVHLLRARGAKEQNTA